MYEDWISKQECMERTGLSERTIERKIQKKEIRFAHRPTVGSKPITVLHPDDVHALAVEVVKPSAAVPATQQTDLPKRQADMAALLALLPKNDVALKDKFYLTIKEAALLAGFPQAYILRKVKNGDIPAIRIPTWRIKRTDLENYTA
jgi:excisionase family DNA binding protein